MFGWDDTLIFLGRVKVPTSWKNCMIALTGEILSLVNYNDLTATEAWNHGFYREIIPFYGRPIQVSEIL